MARIRSIHPGLYTDDAFMALSMAARIFFVGIWTEADDQGAFAWKPFVLKARIFPADNVQIDDLLGELLSVGLIMKVEADRQPIGLVKNFCKWQRPQKPSLFFDIPEHLRSFVGLNDEKENDGSRKKAIWARFSGRCFYCSAEVSYYGKRHNSLEIDHVVPVSKGGTDHEYNLVCACRGCNRAKSDMSAYEFFAFRKLKKLPISEGFAERFSDNRAQSESFSQRENSLSQCENNIRTAEGRKVGRYEGNVGCNAPDAPPEKPIEDRWQELGEEVIAAAGTDPSRSMVQTGGVRQWLADARAVGYGYDGARDIILGVVREKAKYGGRGKPPAWFDKPVSDAIRTGTISARGIQREPVQKPKSRQQQAAETWASVPDIEGV